jgi:hypothetical protein
MKWKASKSVSLQLPLFLSFKKAMYCDYSDKSPTTYALFLITVLGTDGFDLQRTNTIYYAADFARPKYAITST